MKSKSVLAEEEKIKKAQETEGNYIPTEDEDIILKRVYKHYQDAKNSKARQDYEADCEMADKDYNAYVEPNDPDDYRSNINKPISFSIIETMEQETIERKPRPYTEPRSNSDEKSSQFTNDVMKYSLDVGNFDLQYILARKESRIRGTGFLFEYYRYDKRTVGDLKLEKDENGELVEKYTEGEKVYFDDLYAEQIDGQWLYFDPFGSHISKKRYMVRKEILNIDSFYSKYQNKRGFINVDKVKGSSATDWSSFYQPEEITGEDEVEVLHYYNTLLDRYDVVANNIVIRKGYNPYPHHELPVIPVYCVKDPNKFYGIGVPKMVQALREERNTNSNLRLDAGKMGIHKMFFIDDMVELEDIDLIPRPHGFIPVNTNGAPISQKIMPMEYSNVPLSSYKEEEILLEDIRRATGVDDRIQGVNQGGTATEAAILKEATMRRINAQNIMNETDALVRFGMLRLENIKFYYTIPKFEKILGKDDLQEKYRTISVNGKEYKIGESGELIVDEIEGTSNFELGKDFQKFLEPGYDIVVKADSSYVISKPLKQAKLNEMLDRIASNPLLMSEADGKKLGKLLSKVNEYDPRDWMREPRDTEEMEFLAQQENEVMVGGYPIPPTKGATQEHTRVHLDLANSVRYQELDPVIQQVIEVHIKGEATEQGVGQEAPPNQASQLPNANVNPVDLQPNNPMGQ